MFGVICGTYMVSGAALSVSLMFDYTAVMCRTVDMTVPKVKLLLSPSGLSK